ncbi:phosphatidylinositol N-acetylglucosaminyltransferase subunit Y-like [Octodon degus]|uniref:Phosphatidylinositol N-acetylglucosaminyltransferase subunit Y-like n=1 Tax=Octodon degus TaxID=10160 RepID=A0A6P3VAB4_OCTDE|nr:phosphatidylinositol N-acetylglucosaminyltransferase subunit Y-like [Octodon degus]
MLGWLGRRVVLGGRKFLSLPTLTVLIPLISLASLAGLFYSASLEEDFPQGCTSTASLCFYSLLLPIIIPVYVFFPLCTWMGIKLFRHN